MRRVFWRLCHWSEHGVSWWELKVSLTSTTLNTNFWVTDSDSESDSEAWVNIKFRRECWMPSHWSAHGVSWRELKVSLSLPTFNPALGVSRYIPGNLKTRQHNEMKWGSRVTSQMHLPTQCFIISMSISPHTPTTNDSIPHSFWPLWIRNSPSSPHSVPHELAHICSTNKQRNIIATLRLIGLLKHTRK